VIFSIQRYLEDYLQRVGLNDPDQFAVHLAKLYDSARHSKSDVAFLAAMKRIRTVFYRTNSQMQRGPFERKLLTMLDAKFKKKQDFARQRRSSDGLRLLASI
jgi:hypothetical protein